MPKQNRASMQSRIILFVAIVGLAMIGAALLYPLLPDAEGSQLSARHLRATADALDERATEIAQAATRQAPSSLLDQLGISSANGSTPVPSANPAKNSNLTSRQSPVPWGESWPTPDGLLIRVVDVDLDAWPRVLAENQFNDPPAEGIRMVMVMVEVTNEDGGSDTPCKIDDSDYRVVGERGVIYSSFDSTTRCGVIPDELDWELFSGATVSGNVCVMLPKDEGELRLIYKPGSGWDEDVVYFDLAE